MLRQDAKTRNRVSSKTRKRLRKEGKSKESNCKGKERSRAEIARRRGERKNQEDKQRVQQEEKFKEKLRTYLSKLRVTTKYEPSNQDNLQTIAETEQVKFRPFATNLYL